MHERILCARRGIPEDKSALMNEKKMLAEQLARLLGLRFAVLREPRFFCI